VVATTNNRDELLEIICREQPDIAVVDYSMPGVNIPQLLGILRERHISTAILALTGNDEASVAEEIFSAGARGYLLKNHAFELLLAAVQMILSEKTYICPQVAGELLAGQGTTPRAKTLSIRQLEILQLVAEGHTSKHIAGQLELHVKTVDNHRSGHPPKIGSPLRGRNGPSRQRTPTDLTVENLLSPL